MIEIAFEQAHFAPLNRRLSCWVEHAGLRLRPSPPISLERRWHARQQSENSLTTFFDDPYSCERSGQSGETPKADTFQCSAAPLMILRRRSGIPAARLNRFRIVGLSYGRRLKQSGGHWSGGMNGYRMRNSSRSICMPAANSSSANSIGERIENNRLSGSCL